MKQWKIMDTGMGTAQENMDLDAKFLEDILPGNAPILHLYGWKGPCATYGYFTKPETIFRKEALEEQSIHVGRRPTGGGVIFHLTDFAFSLIIPEGHQACSLNTLERYQLINKSISAALVKFSSDTLDPTLFNAPCTEKTVCASSFCMAKPTQYDIMIGGKKVGGAAQRKTKRGLLHQGSISLMLPSFEFLKRILITDDTSIEAMKRSSFALISTVPTLERLEEMKKRLASLIFEELNLLNEEI